MSSIQQLPGSVLIPNAVRFYKGDCEGCGEMGLGIWDQVSEVLVTLNPVPCSLIPDPFPQFIYP